MGGSVRSKSVEATTIDERKTRRDRHEERKVESRILIGGGNSFRKCEIRGALGSGGGESTKCSGLLTKKPVERKGKGDKDEERQRKSTVTERR